MELRAASKAFGRTRVFEGIDFTARSGDVTAVLGLNGAGKTTLLRMLAGLLGFDDGSLSVRGEAFDRFSVEQRRVFHFVPDFPVFFDDLTMRANIGAWLHLYQREGEEAEQRAMALVEEFHLMEKSDMPVLGLSRGQRFKLSLAALVAVDTDVWLLDEPFASGMDPEGLAVFRREARAATNRGRAVVYSTQLAELAMDFSDRIVVLHEGAVNFDGGADDFYQRVNGGDEVLRRFLPDGGVATE